MSPRPDLGPKPRLGYTESLIERAAELRANAAALAALENDSRARAYVIGGETGGAEKGAGCAIRCSRSASPRPRATGGDGLSRPCSTTRQDLRSRSIRRR